MSEEAAEFVIRVSEESLARWFSANLTFEAVERLGDDEFAALLIDHFANGDGAR